MAVYTYCISLKFKYVTFIKFLWNFLEGFAFNFNEIREVLLLHPSVLRKNNAINPLLCVVTVIMYGPE